MATKARKAKKTSVISKRASVISKGTSVVSKKWIIDAIIRYRGHLLIASPPDWAGSYTIRSAPNAIKAIVLDGVNPNKFKLTKLDIGIAGVDAYLCTVVPAGRQNSYWNNTVFIAVGDVALTPVSFTDIGGMDVDAPYPAATLANPLNYSLLVAAAMPNVYSQTERLLGAIIVNGKIEYLGLYRLRHSLDNSGDVIFVELYDPTTQVNGGFPGGSGVGSRP